MRIFEKLKSIKIYYFFKATGKKTLGFKKSVDKFKKWCYNVIGFEKSRKENIYEKRWIRESRFCKILQWVYG